MSPQAVTRGARVGRRINNVVRVLVHKEPERVSYFAGFLTSIVGCVSVMIGPQSTAELLRILVGKLDGQPQLELPPGVRLALAAAQVDAEDAAGVPGSEEPAP
jgi:hypothetical protein